ncbi:MAG: hypothetical protein HYY01_11455 [Chloroflexi bacterium]|nr:hypothetical protein [Chloroflexota bacterium]
MADNEALRQVLGGDARVPHLSNPENNCRPAKLLGDIFRRNGKEYNKTTDPPRLAAASDPRRIAAAVRTFREFQEALLEPQISGKNTPPRSRQ